MSLTPETTKLYGEVRDAVNKALRSFNPGFGDFRNALVLLLNYFDSFLAKNEAYAAFRGRFMKCMEREASVDSTLKAYIELFPGSFSEASVSRIMRRLEDNLIHAAVESSKLNAGMYAVYYSRVISIILSCMADGLIATEPLTRVRVNA